MITAWAVYAVALTALVALAARAAEEMLDAWGLPARWVWTAAAAGSVAVPTILRWDLIGQIGRRLDGLLDASAGGAAVGGSVAAEALAASPPPPAGGWPELLQFPAVADRAVVAIWVLGSALILAGALRAWWRVRRGRRRWPTVRIDGTEVRVSTDIGPAVSGVLDPVIVVPRRIVELPEEERRLVVAHEREHREAGDPTLLAVGLVALAVCPWNPALWWVVRRLRLAVERDCDRRVIEAGAEPRAYGTVLLAEAGARRAALPAAALGHGRSQLEHRIRALARGAPRFRILRSAAAAIAGAALLVVACDAPIPSESEADGADEVTATAPSVASSVEESRDGDRPRFVPRDVAPRAVNDREIRNLLVERYPPLLKDAGVRGSTRVWIYVDRGGAVENVRIQKSSGYESMDRAALEVARQMEFEPARSDGRPVGVWVSRQITFRAEPDGRAGGDTLTADSLITGIRTSRSGLRNDEGGETDQEVDTVDVRGPDDRMLKIRGNAALDFPRHTLIFLDDERIDDRSVLDDLQPEDIEAIEVIKGPAAEALYGAEAADGVIRVTTKGGT